MVAAVARNSNGDILCSTTRRFPNTSSVFYAELLAIQVGTELAFFQGHYNVIIETDSAMAIGEINKGDRASNLWKGIVFDIISLSCLMQN